MAKLCKVLLEKVYEWSAKCEIHECFLPQQFPTTAYMELLAVVVLGGFTGFQKTLRLTELACYANNILIKHSDVPPQ